MDAFECIATKLEVREFSMQDIASEIRSKILEAARLTGTGMNTQHWRFILVERKDNLKKLAEDSTSGSWVARANFAIIVLTKLMQEGCYKICNWSMESWHRFRPVYRNNGRKTSK